jgi:hypothetical protein
MSTVATATPVTLDRYELPGNLAALAALAASGQVTIRPHEIIRTTDGRVYHWTTSALEIVSAPVHHGTVANVAALDGIYLLPSCTRGVHPGDTAFVTSSGCEYRVTSGINAAAVWAACTTLPTIPTTPAEVGADPAGTAATAVSTHNTATDSHTDLRTLIDGKQAALTISDVGTALLNISTPASVQIPRINADGSVTLIDVPSGGGGGSARGLYSGLMSETIPSQSSTGLTTWVNQGGATAADTPIGLQVVNPTTGADDNIRGLVMPVPATPYTLTALLELASVAGNYPSALLGWADSASTKTHIVTLCGDGRSGLISPTTYSSWTLSGASTFTRDGRRCWLQFSDNGTTIAVRWSFSGVYWYTLFSGAKASSHLGSAGYNRLFFGASSSGITGVATLLSWSVS